MDRTRIVNLMEDESFTAAYVNLRNRYADSLLTSLVSIDETKEWLKNADIEIRGIVVDNILQGVVILYLNKGREVTFFVREPLKGIGTELLKIIDRIAVERQYKRVWAWVLEQNYITQRVFEKSGYIKKEINERECKNNSKVRGIVLEKFYV